jgi:hypothetical protein
MEISDQQILDWFASNPEANDKTIASTMDQFNLTPADIARATKADLSNVQSRYEAASPAKELSANPTLAELQAMYNRLGAGTMQETYTEGGSSSNYVPTQYGGGWSAWEKAPSVIGYQAGPGGGEGGDQPVPIYDDKKQLGGFSKQEGDYITSYDLNGNVVGRQKWNYNMLKQTIKDLGPMAIAAMTMGGGNALLGNALFGLEGTAAATAGGALAGGVNAYGNDQNILKGTLLGGVSGAGSAKLADILGADTVGQTFKNATVGDVTKAINFAQNPTLAGAANIASPYVTTNFNIGDTGLTTSDILKGVTTAQALGSGNYKQVFDAITGLAKGTNVGGLTADEQAQLEANRATKEANRLGRIEDAVLNQPASDDGSTQGVLDLINEMYPSANVKGMSQGDLAKFLEANLNDIQGSADLETLLKGAGKPTADEGTLTVTGDRPVGLGDFMWPTSDIGDQGTVVVTGNRENEPYVPSLRTKEIKSDIPDVITPDQIDKLKFDTKIDDILQTVTPITKVVTPTKTVTPTTTTTPTTKQLLANLGLQEQAPSQDPYANIKLMEELFGGDTAYKLRSLGAPKNLASADIDALTRLLRG